jgi:hypothetical protein
MTIEQDFVFEMRRLKRALLPEVLWGTVECLLFLWINTIFVIYHSWQILNMVIIQPLITHHTYEYLSCDQRSSKFGLIWEGTAFVQDQDYNSNCVIPVLLEECKIPIKLQHLTYSDMTIEQDFVFEMRRLKRALLPEVLTALNRFYNVVTYRNTRCEVPICNTTWKIEN